MKSRLLPDPPFSSVLFKQYFAEGRPLPRRASLQNRRLTGMIAVYSLSTRLWQTSSRAWNSFGTTRQPYSRASRGGSQCSLC